MNNNDINIIRYLSGEADTALISEVENWINGSGANKAEFKLYQTIWNQTSDIHAVKAYDVESEWKSIEDRLIYADTSKSSAPIISLKNRKDSIPFKKQG